MTMSSQGEEKQVSESVKVRSNENVNAEVEAAKNNEEACAASDHTTRRVFDPKQGAETAHEEPKAEEPEAAPEDFSQLLAENDSLVEKKSFHVGMIVEGNIVQIGNEFAYVDLGSKAEASIPVAELMNAETGKFLFVPGDKLKAKIIGFDQSGIKLSRSLKSAGNIALEEAFHSGCAVKATVKGINKGGYELEVMGHRAFCPLSQISKEATKDPNEHVGQSYEFKVIKYGKKGRDIVLSRTALIDDANKIKREELLSTIKVGDVLDATISSIQDYGAFVDLGGIDGLVHVSEISYKHVGNPNSVLTVGQKVKVYVLAIEDNPKGGKKLALSMKKLEEDPFVVAQSWLVPGARVKGTVVRNVKFGTFVELAPGIEGLIHISELGWGVKRSDDILKVGSEIEANILSVDMDQRRVSLSLKGAQKSPWETITERYSTGDTVKGTIDSVADFGIFVKLEPGVTALLPLSEIGEAHKDVKDLKAGDSIEAHVLAIDTDRKRFTLSVREPNESAPKRERSERPERTEHPKRERSEKREDGDRPRRKEPRISDNEYSDVRGSFASMGDVFASLKKGKK